MNKYAALLLALVLAVPAFAADLKPSVHAPMPPAPLGPVQTAPAKGPETDTPTAAPRSPVTRAVNASTAMWTLQGPTQSMSNGSNVNNIPAAGGNPANPQIGAVNRIATQGSTILVATPNGGIWRSTNTGTSWTPVTDNFQLSTYAVSYDFNAAGTVVAGFGRSSSLGDRGSSTVGGIIRSTDDGVTWTALAGNATLPNLSVSSVQSHAATSTILVTFKNTVFSNDGGIFRSTDNGATFTDLGSTAPLTPGSYMDLVGDPANPGTYYAAHRGSGQTAGQTAGVFRTTNDGLTWTNITGTMSEIGSTTDYIRIAVGPTSVVFVGIVNNNELAAVYRATDAQTAASPAWTAMAVPAIVEMGTTYGIHPGKQGGSQFGIAADPTNNNIVYVSGDRQPANNENGQAGVQFPNSLGAQSYSVTAFRGTFGGTPVWESITNTGRAGNLNEGTASNSSPHADSRELMFEAAGNLLMGCDGGIYRRNLPRSKTGDWTSADGNLAITEFHSIAYDGNFNVAMGGAQDNGVTYQTFPNAPTWPEIAGGDGGKVAIDDSVAGTSIRYSCGANWGPFERRTVVAGNVTDTTQLGLKLGAQTVFQFDNNAVQFYGPYTLNAINPVRIVFGTDRVLESSDRGDTLTDISGQCGNPVSALVYGGTTGGVANPDLIYAGSGSALRARTTAGGTLNVLPTYQGGTIRAIACDPTDYNIVAIADSNNKIWISLNGGATPFNDVTGNLPLTNLQTLTFLPAANNVRPLLAGGQGGVYAAGNGEFNVWTKIGTNLPAQVQVDDIKYDARANVLCIAALGRGAYTIANASNIFSGPLLTVTSIVPNRGPVAGGNTVTINGTGFAGTPVVLFGANAATGVAAVTPTSFTCVAPASTGAAIGAVNVTVTASGQDVKKISAYTYENPPSITALEPSQGVATGGTTVVITGANFDTATGATTVTFGGVAATGIVVNAGNQITCVSPAGTVGAANVVVSVNGVNSAPATFTYLAAPPPTPSVTLVNAATGPALGGTSVTVTGTNFDTTANATTVTFNGVMATTVSVTSATTLTCTTPPSTSSTLVPVVVTVSGVASAPANLFTYTGTDAPMVTVQATTPDATDPMAPHNPDENGYGIITISLSAPLPPGVAEIIGFELSGNARPGTDYEAVGGNTITIVGPDQSADVLIVPIHRTAVTGPETVTLTITSGPEYLVGPQNSATVTIEDMNEQDVGIVIPNTGGTAGGDAVMIQGANFDDGMDVFFNGVPATDVEILSPALIRCITPPGAAGTVDVTVDNDGIDATLTNGFTYVPPPTLTTVSPSVGPLAGGTAVTITGTNFAAPAQVTFNGVAATNVVVVSATTITCQTPAGSAGQVPVAITVNGVTRTLANAFTYQPAPVLAGLTPNSGPQAGGTSVTIFGANFVAGAIVTFGGNAAANVVIVSPNSLTCVTPPGAAGTVAVSVNVNGSAATLSNVFTYLDSDNGTLTVTKLQGKFNFKKSASDLLHMEGTLPLTTSFAGVAVEVVIGGFDKTYTLSDKSFSTEFAVLKLKNGASPFKLNVKKADLFAKLSSLGFSQTANGVITVPVTIRVNGTGYKASKTVTYTARTGTFK